MSIAESEQFDKKLCNELKTGEILVVSEGGNSEYIKIRDISTAKPGKHGSAKCIISGTSIRTKKNYEATFVSGTRVGIATLKRRDYVLSDIHGDEISLMKRGAEEGKHEAFKMSDFSEKDMELLKSVFDPDGKGEVTLTLVTAAGLCIVEDLRKGGEVVN